ncbi:MAG: DUF86 domain-containing protein [Promethearchaeia archaeon]
MNKNRDRVLLNHILDACSQITYYLEEIDFSNFEENRLLQDGVIRELEIIGEATKNLSKTVREKVSNVPWKLIAGMRDKLIHGYFSVDLKEVWNTAKRDIPNLKNKIENILANL